jgi:hypothetical protein
MNFFGLTTGCTSFLEMDHSAREDSYKALIGSQREMVLSDTSNERLLQRIVPEELERMSYDLFFKMKTILPEPVENPNLKGLTIGIVDGTTYSHIYAVSFCLMYGTIKIPVDLEIHQKGEELNAAKRLMQRAGKYLGNHYLNLLVYDGLGYDQEMFRMANKHLGADLFVKTKEKTLQIREEMDLLLENKDKFPGALESLNQFDIDRLERYQIYRSTNTMNVAGYEKDVFVTKVFEENHAKKKGEVEHEEYLTITSRKNLTLSQTREIAVGRWQIETGVFRTLNALVMSKKKHSDNYLVLKNLMMIFFMAYVVLQTFVMDLCSRPEVLRKSFGAENKNTLMGIVRILKKTVMLLVSSP